METKIILLLVLAMVQDGLTCPPSKQPATTSAPSGPPTSSPTGVAVPNIPVQNRFDVISEEGNE